MEDYISVEYSDEKRPQTSYPAKLAKYLFIRFKMQTGQSILEVGSGRSELLEHFKKMGMETYAIDSANSAAEFANKAGASFELYNLSSENSKEPFNGKKFDVIFSKSFIEHLHDPIYFFEWSKSHLNYNGKLISLTPDWESSTKIFYDDVTHVKPFTKVSLNQILELGNFKEIEVFKFRQLPITWSNPFALALSKLTAMFTQPRVKQKWFRWSRELMLASVGKNIN
jgi:2-polyprenyl-3-methyl-5-hydroxy-6-metoxy-1,4-benzoquinol methylase